MIADKTYKVKVWGHNDAAVFVYENRHKKINPEDTDCHKYKHWQEVLTAIPINFGYDENLSEEMVLEKVQAVADSLQEVYQYDSDTYEIGISYVINYNRHCVNA